MGGETNKGLHAGDWCYLLSADGIQQNAEPYLIASLRPARMGSSTPRFLETDTGWPWPSASAPTAGARRTA